MNTSAHNHVRRPVRSVQELSDALGSLPVIRGTTPAAIAAEVGGKEDEIICGTGSDDILVLITRAYAGGWQVAVQANGDAAIDQAIVALTADGSIPAILARHGSAAAGKPK